MGKRAKTAKTAKRGRRAAVATLATALCVAASGAFDAFAASEEDGVGRAVLVGVDDYDEFDDLRFAGADVELTRERLLALGFAPERVVALTTAAGRKNGELAPTRENIRRELKRLWEESGPNDVAFVMFSGHGFQAEEFDGFKPYVGFASQETKASVATGVDFATTVSLSEVFEELKACEARFKCALVDACRENFERSGAPSSLVGTRGAGRAKALRELTPPPGVAILQSCGPGEVSWEDERLGHGVFTHAFAESLTALGDENGDGKVTFLEAAGRTSAVVKEETKNSERYSSVQTPYLSGKMSDFVLLDVDGSNAEPKAGTRKTATIRGVEFAFRYCPANDGGAAPTRGFWIAETEATQEMWEAATGENPSEFSADGADAARAPVESATWFDCRDFIEKLNEAPDLPRGFVFRLPTEAEWEFAASAGGSVDPADVGEASKAKRPARVGERGANAWGVADAVGNVCELCVTADGKPVWRGGGWKDGGNCGLGSRRERDAKYWSADAGLRLALEIEEE